MMMEQQQHLKKRRTAVKSILFLSAITFFGIIVLDGLVQFTDLSSRVETSVHDTVIDAAELIDGYERRLENGVLLPHHNHNQGGQHHLQERRVEEKNGGGGGGGVASRFLRRLADYLLDEDEFIAAAVPPHRSYSEGTGGGGGLGYVNNAPPSNNNNNNRALLHTLPLLPKHALQHRQRRELIAKRLPIPRHLQEGYADDDDEEHDDHLTQFLNEERRNRRRRRMYPMIHDDGEEIVDARMLVQEEGGGDGGDLGRYETGALYQGYGTHYLDLWVGTPPQRQTVIIDTGSSITAFPCTGCENCGSNPTTGEQYHLDDDYNVEDSESYQEKECKPRAQTGGKTKGGIPCDLGVCSHVSTQTASSYQCKLAVSYAEGSSWTALEGSDVVYPAGSHEMGLEGREARLGAGVGVGMGSEEFDWMDFRLKFGCQTKVTGLFRTQLEDGIMGMDNRKGAFWLQLHEHYQRNGYLEPAKNNGDNQGGGSSEASRMLSTSSSTFDPAQFSLCYDRQPLSIDLTPGVGSGALTLGGTDPLLHNTDMVFAQNVTPKGGWYTVRIKAVFLRTKGGTLSEPYQGNDAKEAVDYVRVNTAEDVLNGSPNKQRGVIVDSGTTDTYLPLGLKDPFQDAWKTALGGDGEEFSQYHNNNQKLTPEQVKSMPTILLVLQGHHTNENENAIGMTGSHEEMFKSKEPTSISKSDVVVAIPPTHYLEESHSEPGNYKSRVYFTERYGAQSILGSNFMMGHEVNFDVGRGAVGFAESHCDYSRYVKERDAKQQELLTTQQEEEDTATTTTEAVQSSAEEKGNVEAPHMESDLAASGWARG
ncbi:hypothetical protein ACHAXR_007993 [Thalassiosira sp. AJA248-18]